MYFYISLPLEYFFSLLENISTIQGLATFCGVAKVGRRIVGGSEPPIGKYPWLALIGFTKRGRSKQQWACGGALIGDQYVLTAAHCVTGIGPYSVYVVLIFSNIIHIE